MSLEPLRARTLFHAVSFRSHMEPCAELARRRWPVTHKNSYNLLNAHTGPVPSLMLVREEVQPMLLDPGLPPPSPLPSFFSFSNFPGLLAPQPHTLQLPAGPLPQQSCRVSTHCQANISSDFSGEGIGALLCGLTPKLLADGTALASAKCHLWQSLLPGKLELPDPGCLSGRPSPLAEWPCLVIALHS